MGCVRKNIKKAARIRRAALMVAAASVMGPAVVAHAQQYTITDVGTIGTGNESIAYGINDLGQVAGWSRITSGGSRHAFRWTNGTITDLGTLLTGNESFAYGINDSGVVVGRSFTSGGSGNRAFRWNGSMTDLSTLGVSTTSEAWGINNSGQIVGNSGASGSRKAFIITGGTTTLIPGTFVNGGESWAQGINDAGQVVGYAQSSNQGNQKAFYWGGSGNIQQLASTLGGTDSLAYDINSTGQISGFSDTTGDAQTYAFRYTSPTMTSLGALGTGISSEAWGVNDSGVAVGSSFIVGNTGATRAFVATGNTMLDLNALIDPASGWVLTDARDINNLGQIVGKGTIGGQGHAFVATPIPAWANAAGGTWATSSNWNPPVVPATSGMARFDLNSVSPYTVTLNAPAQVTMLLIQTDKPSFNLNSQTLTASTALMIGALTGQNGQMAIASGTFSTPNVYVSGNATAAGGTGALTVNSGATMAVSGTLKIWNTAGSIVTLNGGTISTGTLDTNGDPTHFFGNGSTTGWVAGTLEINNSNLIIGGAGPLGSSVTIGSGRTLRINSASQFIGIDAGSTLNFTGGKLDLTDKNLIATSGDAGAWNGSNYTGITGQIKSGRNGGSWNGSGITTSQTSASAAVPLTTLGIALADEVGYGGAVTFAGQTVVATDVLVMYTYAGDATLDGMINGDDYFSIDNGFASQLTGYVNGDFDYNGKINADDYFLIDANYVRQGPPLAPALGAALSAVPEPAALALVVPACMSLLRRRSRR